MTQSFNIDFTINWNDYFNNDGQRPESVNVLVYGQSSTPTVVTITGESDAEYWTLLFKDLPVWKSGVNTSEQIEYTFALETEIEHYVATAHLGIEDDYDVDFYHFTGVSANGDYEDDGTFTWSTVLTHEKFVYDELTGIIIWDDDGDRDGLRPTSILVQLYANDEPIGDPIEVTGSPDDEQWTVTWEDLDMYFSQGTDVTYTLVLVNDVTEYTCTLTGAAPVYTTLIMSHDLITYNVTGTVIWDDDSQFVGNIERSALNIQFYSNGVAVGDLIEIEKPDSNAASVIVTLYDMPVYYNHGQMITYTIELFDVEGSDPLLSDLIAKGYTTTLDSSNPLDPVVTIAHTYYDVAGYVYLYYDSSEEFLVEGAEVTIYILEDGKYVSYGSAITDENGYYYIENVPCGDLEIRAVYEYNGVRLAGKVGRTLDRIDLISDEEGRGHRVDVILNYDATIDDEQYTHNVTGTVYYEFATVNENGDTIETIREVAPYANILVYKVDETTNTAVYVTFTTTDENGNYTIPNLEAGTYQLTVYITYEDAPYTYDNADAIKDGLTFVVTSSDTVWSDIVVKLPNKVDVNEDSKQDEEPEDTTPEATVINGFVFYEINGVHTTDPIANVDVYIYSNVTNTLVVSATTDINGEFIVEGIPVGDYTAVYSYEGHASRVQVFMVTDSDFETGSLTINPVYFEKDDNTGLATVSGTILNADGDPYNVIVYLYVLTSDGEKGDLAGVMYTDEYGHYNFTVEAGSSYLAEYYAVNTVVTTESIVYPATGDSDVVISSYVISGVVTDDDGNTVSGAIVNLYYNELIVNNTMTDADGAYCIDGIDPNATGTYILEIFFEDGTTERHYLTVGYDAPTVSEAGTGYTISGEAETGATVTLRKNNGGIVTPVTYVTVTDGTYTFTNIAEGDYEILIKNADGTEELIYIVVPNTLMQQTVLVTISGYATDSNGYVRTANVDLLDDGVEVEEIYITLADGYYEFTNIEYSDAHTYTIRIAYPVAGTQLDTRTTEQPDSYGISYVGGMTVGSEWIYNLNATGAYGIVTDQNGNPLEGVVVILTSTTIITEGNVYKTYSTTTDVNGYWYIGVPADSYTVYAYLVIDDSHSYGSSESPTITVEDDAVETNLTIYMVTVNGEIVRSGDNAPVPYANITIINESNPVDPEQLIEDNTPAVITPILYPNVIFDAGTNGGTVNGESIYAIAAKDLTAGSIPTAKRSGYTFKGWYTTPSSTDGVKLTTADIETINATEEPITYYARFSSSGGGGGGGGSSTTYYTITTSTDSGATVDPLGTKSVASGGTQVVTISVKDGYVISKVLVDGVNVGSVSSYTFSNVTASHTLEVTTSKGHNIDVLTEEHIAYIYGYAEDGLAHPERNLTRGQFAAIIYRLLKPEVRNEYLATSVTFDDVASNAWYAIEVETLRNAGLIEGTGNNMFEPERSITRAEMVAMICRFLEIGEADDYGFLDISGHWCEDLINFAASKGWVLGYADGMFLPDNAITRAEAITIMNRVMERDNIDSSTLIQDGMIRFGDNMDKSTWYYYAIQEAANGHEFMKDSDSGHETWTTLQNS